MTDSFAVYPSLRGRVVFITGGASGIGAAEVLHFAAQGAKVAFVDIAGDAAALVVASAREAGHPEPLYQHCDLHDIPSLQAAIRRVGETLGPITVLVNNAANDQRQDRKSVV